MRFALLGPLDVIDGDRPLTPSAPKVRQVLALLVIRRNHLVQSRELIDELWGEDPPRSALATLQTYVYKLRKVLLVEDRDECGQLVQTRPSGYQVTIGDDQLDLCQFEALLEEGQAALDSDPGTASQALRRALGLWRGTALADVDTGDILAAYATRLEESRLRALEMRIEADLRLGRHAALISELKALVSTHLLHEGFSAKLMLALYRSGRQFEALEVYRNLRDHVVSELGLEPSPALQRLNDALISSDSRLDAPDPARGNGEVVTTTPRRPGHAITPAQLPPDISDLCGRQQLLADAERRILCTRDPGATTVRVLSLTGMPGAGKTTLAIHLAHRLAGRFPGGQLFATLAGSGAHRSAGQPATEPPAVRILGEFLSATEIPPESIPGDLTGRSNLFRSWTASRPVLVVLDAAESAAQVQPLLPSSPGCVVIITSQSGLHGLPFAHRVDVDLFTPAEAVDLLTRSIGPDRAERESLERIAALCGYLPLAVRCAGARLAATHGWTPAMFVDQLLAARARGRLDELRFQDLDVRTRFAAAVDRLSARERSTFRLLGLFAAEFTSNHVARLLGCDDRAAEAMVAPLVEQRLVRMIRDETGDGIRYVLHELLRFYAKECLDSELDAELDGPYELLDGSVV